MEPMDAFEQQLTRVATRVAGPVRPVDAMDVVRSAKAEPVSYRSTLARWFGGGVTTPNEKGFSMFSALKFMVAGVIVALFGGFLLAGILTTQQGDEMVPAALTESPDPEVTSESPEAPATSVRTDILPGISLTVEEFEPGVFHTLNDGVRDLAGLPIGDWGSGATVTVDEAGAVWRFTPDGAFRLGAEDEWHVGGSDTDLPLPDFATARGRVVTGPDVLTDLLGPESATPEELGLDGGVSVFEAQADGTLWLLGDGSLVRVSPGGVAEVLDWKDVYDGLVDGLAVTPDGDAWLMGKPEVGQYPAEVFLHFAGDDWEVVPVPTESLPGPLWAGPLDGNQRFDVGPDGSLWADLVYRQDGGGDPRHRSLARYDGSGWTVFGEADGVRPWDQGMWPYNMDREMRVAPDGSVWVIASGSDEPPCAGLGRFDGESWTSFMPDMCIASYDVAPDGAVWVVAGDRDAPQGLTIETYVITPDAVAAKVAEVAEPPSGEATSEAEEAAPVTTEQLLSGMVTEEVETGVYRIVNDGLSDFAYPVDSDVPYDIVAGHDGGIYVLEPGHYARLGQGGGSAQGHKGFDWRIVDGFPSDVGVAPDGTVWAVFESHDGGRLYSTAWGSGDETLHLPTAGEGPIEVTPDGTVWAVWLDDPEDPASAVFGYLGVDGWTMVGEWPFDGGYLLVSDRGDVWATTWGGWDILETHRFVDGAWRTEDGLAPGDPVLWPPADVGVEGTLWGIAGASLVRFDGTEWTTFAPPDWIPTDVRQWRLAEDGWVGGDWTMEDTSIAIKASWWGEPHLAPDGSLWVSQRLGVLDHDPDLGGGHQVICDHGIDGVVRFDGEAWSRYLQGHCVETTDVAADGSVWVLASKSGARYPLAHVYVITPEAVAATE